MMRVYFYYLLSSCIASPPLRTGKFQVPLGICWTNREQYWKTKYSFLFVFVQPLRRCVCLWGYAPMRNGLPFYERKLTKARGRTHTHTHVTASHVCLPISWLMCSLLEPLMPINFVDIWRSTVELRTQTKTISLFSSSLPLVEALLFIEFVNLQENSRIFYRIDDDDRTAIGRIKRIFTAWSIRGNQLFWPFPFRLNFVMRASDITTLGECDPIVCVCVCCVGVPHWCGNVSTRHQWLNLICDAKASTPTAMLTKNANKYDFFFFQFSTSENKMVDRSDESITSPLNRMHIFISNARIHGRDHECHIWAIAGRFWSVLFFRSMRFIRNEWNHEFNWFLIWLTSRYGGSLGDRLIDKCSQRKSIHDSNEWR